MFVGQDEFEGLDVCKKVLWFASTDNGKNKCRLLHQVRDGHCSSSAVHERRRFLQKRKKG